MDKYLLKPSTSSESELRKRPADDMMFSLPKKTASRHNVPTKPKFHTGNRFSNLPPDEKLDSEATAFKEASTLKKTSRIPPIIISIKQGWTHATIKDMISKYDKSFALQYRGSNKVAVLCSSAKGHQSIKQGLIDEDAFFHTYTRKDEKSYKVVILGLPSYAEDDLPQELNDMGFKDINITKLKTAPNKHVTCPPYLVQLPAGSDIHKFRQIKYLCSCVVNIRKYRKSSTLGSQCFRCQEFGHASRNCNLPARCVKCTGNHSSRECSKTNPEEKATCCNCGLDHPANYSKCTERQKYLQKLKDRNVQQIKPNDKPVMPNFPQLRRLDPSISLTSTSSRPLSSKPSWAQATESSRSKLPSDTGYSNNEGLPTTGNIEDKETLEILEILQAIKAVKARLTASSSIFDKVYLVLTHLGRYV